MDTLYLEHRQAPFVSITFNFQHHSHFTDAQIEAEQRRHIEKLCCPSVVTMLAY